MAEQPELLVTRRSKRSTAGNRMEAALAEMNLEEPDKDAEEDKDFENMQEEEDVFASDFESADGEEEGDAVTVAAAERAVIEEDRRARKVAKSRLEKATAIAHARNKQTFAPESEEVQPSSSKPKVKSKLQRVLTLHIDEETGEVTEPSNKRVSRRQHTVLNTSATISRLKESQLKRSALPKKPKLELKQYTQAQLIAQALDNEEGNLKQHRNYLKNEEAKRRRARVVRTAVEGPLLRWISKEGQDKVLIPPVPPPAPTFLPPPIASATAAASTPFNYRPAGQTFIQSPYSFASTTATSAAPGSNTSTPATPQFQGFQYYNAKTHLPVWPPQTSLPGQSQGYYTTPTTLVPSATTPQTPAAPPDAVASSTTPPGLQETTTPSTALQATTTPSTAPQVTGQPANQAPTNPSPAAPPIPMPPSLTVPPTTTAVEPVVPTTDVSMPQSLEPAPLPKPQDPEYRMERATKNFLIHELSQTKGDPKPSWTETMTALFGDHVRWEDVKVYAGKGRPMSRPKHTCPITGLPANYLDARTGVHFANSDAYKILSQLLQHHYEWNADMGCYMDEIPQDEEGMMEVDG